MASQKEEGHKQQNDQVKKTKGKLALKTGNKDYGGNLGLPEKIVQREFETTGQFFRRLDRLVAKAKVEANLDSRFDTTLGKKGQDKNRRSEDTFNFKPKQKKKTRRRKGNNEDDDDTDFRKRKNFRNQKRGKKRR